MQKHYLFVTLFQYIFFVEILSFLTSKVKLKANYLNIIF